MTLGELLLELIVLVFGLVIIVGVPILLIWSLWTWKETLGSEKPWIKFKDFVKLYNADPDRWNIKYRNNPELCTSDVRNWPRTYAYFKFNYIDLYRYKLWKFNMERQNKKQRAQKTYEEAMTALNIDIHQVAQKPDGKDPRIKALAKDIVDYWNMGRKDKEKW